MGGCSWQRHLPSRTPGVSSRLQQVMMFLVYTQVILNTSCPGKYFLECCRIRQAEVHQKEKGKEESLSCYGEIGGALGLILRRSRLCCFSLVFLDTWHFMSCLWCLSEGLHGTGIRKGQRSKHQAELLSLVGCLHVELHHLTRVRVKIGNGQEIVKKLFQGITEYPELEGPTRIKS